jgi:hypothetical protein
LFKYPWVAPRDPAPDICRMLTSKRLTGHVRQKCQTQIFDENKFERSYTRRAYSLWCQAADMLQSGSHDRSHTRRAYSLWCQAADMLQAGSFNACRLHAVTLLETFMPGQLSTKAGTSIIKFANTHTVHGPTWDRHCLHHHPRSLCTFSHSYIERLVSITPVRCALLVTATSGMHGNVH